MFPTTVTERQGRHAVPDNFLTAPNSNSRRPRDTVIERNYFQAQGRAKGTEPRGKDRLRWGAATTRPNLISRVSVVCGFPTGTVCNFRGLCVRSRPRFLKFLNFPTKPTLLASFPGCIPYARQMCALTQLVSLRLATLCSLGGATRTVLCG